MAKNLKLNIKNTQIAEAINLTGLKGKLAKKKEAAAATPSKVASPKVAQPQTEKLEEEELPKEDAPRIRARSKSAFAEKPAEASPQQQKAEAVGAEAPQQESFAEEEVVEEEVAPRVKSSAQLRRELFGEDEIVPEVIKPQLPEMVPPPPPPVQPAPQEEPKAESSEEKVFTRPPLRPPHTPTPARPVTPPRERLGPTGRHMRDIIKPLPPKRPPQQGQLPSSTPPATRGPGKELTDQSRERHHPKAFPPKGGAQGETSIGEAAGKETKTTKYREFKDVKPARRTETKQFDGRDRQGLRDSDDDQQWRKRRGKQARAAFHEDLTIRPTSLKVRTPISIKDLASEMKLKSSQLISKLFLQGIVVTLNDLLEDETTIQLLGHEFGCDIQIDTAEAKRIQITDKSVKEELKETPAEQLTLRPPVVAFMGHVDHGKTSLIDAIRASNRAAGEAGAITQHIGAFRCKTEVGDIAVLDTPGHEAFSQMRARGADVTDIVVLVVAGDEGLRQQTLEAIQHAKAANVIIVVAINKCDKPNFNAENVYRQLAEQELLPEAWGGQTLTVNCSAVTGEGIPSLLETLALQAEVLELRANPSMRARGTVLESEMHKGMGAVATVLVQNGTLRKGDALVFGQHFGRVKTMHDEYRHELQEAGPSTPVEITGLSGLPEAGEEFIVVKNEKEAREIAAARTEGARQSHLLLQQKKKSSVENLFQQAATTGKKVLNIVLRTDVQGSLEALRAAIMKIKSEKVDVNIISAGVGEISESDIQLAGASKAVVIGFHTQIESHAEPIVKQLGVSVRLHDIIYHAVDDVTALMAGLLDKIAQETEKGKAEVKATFKSSHTGIIAGCLVIEGSIVRNNNIRLRRAGEVIWKGTIASLKRVKEDVREVAKGIECGILLNNFSDIQPGDILEAYEITYIAQEL